MKRSTVELVLIVSALYFALLFLARGVLPSTSSLPLYFLALPLLLVILALVGDLSRRASLPTELLAKTEESRRLARRVQQLTRQVEVGTRSSKSYFESVVLAQLREVLVDKVSLETGLERERVLEKLANRIQGQGLLGSDELYRLLYSEAPPPGLGRTRTLDRIVGMIEEWKP